MKLRYIFASLAATAALFASCTQELQPVSKLAGLEVSNDFVTIEAATDTVATITVKGEENWTAAVPDTTVKWLTVDPSSGPAGTEVSVKLIATPSTAARGTEVHITMGSKVKIINVNQKAPEGVVTPPSTVKEVFDGPDKTYKVTGTVTKLGATTYGNWYLNDGTSATDLYIYGTLNRKGATYDKNNPDMHNINCPANPNAWELGVGDLVTVEGPKSVYNGTVELVDVTIIKIVKSLIKVDISEVQLKKADTTFTAKVLYSGTNFSFSTDASWLNVTGMNTVNDTTFLSIHAAANTEDTRKGTVSLVSTKGEDSSTVTISVTQASGLAAYPLPYNDPLTNGFGSWEAKDIVPVDGVASIWTNSDTYGMIAKATKAADSEAELVSPNIDLNGATSPVLSFEHVSRYAGNVYAELKLFVSIDNGESWTEMQIPVYSSGKNWTYVSSGSISLARFVNNLIKLKFVYKSSTAAYGTWEFKNIKIEDAALAITNIAELNNSATTTEAAWSGEFTDAVISYVNGNNVFIEDATGGIQLYLKGHDLTEGKKISGKVSGKVKLYNGFPELTALDVTGATLTDGEAPAGTVLKIDELLARYLRYQNCKVKLEGVTLDPALTTSNRNTTVKQGDNTIAGYAQIKNSIAIAAATEGDLICWPTRYNATLQVGIWDASHFTAK